MTICKSHSQLPLLFNLRRTIIKTILGANIHTRVKNYATKDFPLITQIHPMGCGVACVASRCNITYSQALKAFKTPKLAWTRGIYCKEIVTALRNSGLEYKFERFATHRHKKHLAKAGTIIFTRPSLQYPSGHYFIRTKNGWMNPWINFPEMTPAKAGIQKNMDQKISYVIFEPLY